MFEADEMESCRSCLYWDMYDIDEEPCKYCYGLSLYTKKESIRMDKEGFIHDITRKLCGNVQLNQQEIHTIISALRESEHCFREPYYEVIYHDKYDNTETRIMNPVDSRRIDMDGYYIQEDRFNLNFRRIIRGDE